MLAATSSAELEELEDYAELRECIALHAGLIYRHVNKLRRLGSDEALYIVTGCIKTDSWAIGAFKEPGVPPFNVMCLKSMMSRGTVDERPRYKWTREGSSSQGRSGLSCTAGQKDQTLFLLGFKLDFSELFRLRMRNPPQVPQGAPPGDGPSDSSRPPEGSSGSRGTPRDDGSGHIDGHPSGGSAFGGGENQDDSAGGDTGRDQGDKEGDPTCDAIASNTSVGLAHDGEVIVQSYPALRNVDHPSDMINRYLLELAGVDFALCHDVEWRFTQEDIEMPDDPLEEATHNIEIDVVHGVAVLSEKGQGSRKASANLGTPDQVNMSKKRKLEQDITPPSAVPETIPSRSKRAKTHKTVHNLSQAQHRAPDAALAGPQVNLEEETAKPDRVYDGGKRKLEGDLFTPESGQFLIAPDDAPQSTVSLKRINQSVKAIKSVDWMKLSQRKRSSPHRIRKPREKPGSPPAAPATREGGASRGSSSIDGTGRGDNVGGPMDLLPDEELKASVFGGPGKFAISKPNVRDPCN